MFREIKPFLISLAVVTGLVYAFASASSAQTVFNVFRSLVPETDSTYYLGTTTPSLRAWRAVITDELCLDSDCRTAWPSGGGGGSDSNWTFFNTSGLRPSTSTNQVLIGGTSTSTRAGLEIADFLNGSLAVFGSTTLQKFTFTNATGTQATTTSLFSTNASTTNLWLSIGSGLLKTDTAGKVGLGVADTDYQVPLTFGDGLTRTANDVDCDTASGSVFGCLTSADWTTFNNKVSATRALTVAGTANQITSSAGSQDLSADRTWTLSFPNHIIFPSSFQVTSATTTHATSTNHDITGLFTFNGVTGNSWDDFCTTITGGAGLCDGTDATGSGGAAAVATSTNETAGRVAYWTSNSGTPATLGEVATTTLTAGTGISTSATLGALLGGSNATLSIDQSFTPTWTGQHIFNNISRATTTNATTTNLTISGNFYVSGLTSALTLTGADGLFAEYAGTSCTNQFVRSLSALGAATCATVGAADVDLADLTATNSTLTFSGTYDGQTARTIGLNLANANTWTAAQTFGDTITTRSTTTSATTTSLFSTTASSTNLFSQNFTFGSSILSLLSNTITAGALAGIDFGSALSFEIPNSSNPTLTAVGQRAEDTTSENSVATSTLGFEYVTSSASTTLYAFSLASTSPDFVSGGVLELPRHPLAQTVRSIGCMVDGGTNKVMVLSDDGTNDATSVTCTTTWQWFTISTNNSSTANEAMRFEVGASSGTPDYVIMRVMGYRTSD